MRSLIFAFLSLGASTAWAEIGEPIRIYGGTGFSGWTEILLFPDDIQQINSFRRDKGIATLQAQLTPDAFEASMAYLRDNPIPESSLTTETCPDYGTDTVEYNGVPEIAYSVGCPDPLVEALADALKGIMVSHGGRKAP